MDTRGYQMALAEADARLAAMRQECERLQARYDAAIKLLQDCRQSVVYTAAYHRGMWSASQAQATLERLDAFVREDAIMREGGR